MATTSNTYTQPNGSTNKLFSITFPYLETTDVDVYLNGTLQTITTQYSFANATTIEFVTAPPSGAVVLLDRSTDDTTLQATFFPGSSIKAADLNADFDQTLYVVQEINNNAVKLKDPLYANKTYIDAQDATKVNKSGDTMSGNLAMGGNKITGLGTTSNASDAATKTYVDNNAVIYSGSPAFTQDGTGAVTRSWSSKLKDVVSLKDFGPVGDGTTNDTAAIQAAINATPVGGTLIFNNATYFTNNYIIINKSITIDFNNSTIRSTAPGFIFLVQSNLDSANKVTSATPITKGQQSFAFAPPTGTVVGSYLWVEYGTDPFDPNEFDYAKFVQVTAVGSSSFTVDWAPSTNVKYTGNPRTNYFTRVTSFANDIYLKNIVTKDINESIDGIFRLVGAVNVVIENHTISGGGICGLRFQYSDNVRYSNVRAPNMQLAMAGWKSTNLVFENVYWSAKKSALILNNPSCFGNESRVVNFTANNIECFIPASQTVYGIFDFSGGSQNCTVKNVKVTGEFTNLTTTGTNNIQEIKLENIQIYNNQNGYNAPQLSYGRVSSLYSEKLGIYYEQGDTFENTITIPLSSDIGPRAFAQGIISDVWLYCTNWSLLNYLLILNSAGSGFNTNSYGGPLTNNQWVKVTPGYLDNIAGSGVNLNYDTKRYQVSLATASPTDYLKIRYRASRQTDGSYARPTRDTEESGLVRTFTPSLVSSNGNLVATTTSGFVAEYIQTGNLATFSIYSTFAVTTAGTGDVRVAGLPFRSRTNTPVSVQSFSFTGAAPIGARVRPNTNYISLYTALFDNTAGAYDLPPLTTSNLVTGGNPYANGLWISGQVLIN
jgi:hypothetical protein